MTPDELSDYHDQNTEDRAAQRAAAAARAEAAADHAAELFIDEVAIITRSTWPGAAHLVFDLDADGYASLHTVEDAGGQALSDHSPALAATPSRPRADPVLVIASLFRTALSFSPTIAEPMDSPDATTRYRLTLPSLPPRVIPLEPSPYGDTDVWDSPVILRIQCRRAGAERFGIVYTGPQGQTRREFGGPKTPGPHASLYPLVSVIDGRGGTRAESARRREAGLEIHAHPGDGFLIGGELFELRDDRDNEYPRLHLFDPLTPN